jgi:tetratricopeptide (TPR) repeat protein
LTEDRRNIGSRLLAFLALWLMLSALVLALSFVDVVLVANAILLVVGATAAAVWGLRRVEFPRKLAAAILVSARAAGRLEARLQRLGIRRHASRFGAAAWSATTAAGMLTWRALRAAGIGGAKGASATGRFAGDTTRTVWQGARRVEVRPRVARAGSRARTRAATMPGRADALLARAVRAYALAVYRLQARAAGALNRRAEVSPSAPERDAPTLDESLQARRLNALGTQLRRQGEHEQAAVQYRVALEIVRDLGDEQAEAMTLNNLGLALAQAGDADEAVEHLEQAREVLHELGDEEHEGQVIANLGIVYRRQGMSDEAETLLHEALDKLPPESPVYRQVERELIRAS